MGRGRKQVVPPVVVDPTGWILESGFAEFVLMHTHEIKYMCMLGYTFMHGCHVFERLPPTSPTSYKLISMILACTGGGILVPIFINSIPVPLAQDTYPIAILVSFLLHTYFPVLREVTALSPWLKAAIVVLYETLRASVVVKFVAAASAAIAPSEFSIPLFGPIFCGCVAGCGGAFLPLDKGLEPIRLKGLTEPMISALIASIFYHLFVNTSLSNGIIDAPKKAHIVVTTFFISFGLYATLSKITLRTSKAKKSD